MLPESQVLSASTEHSLTLCPLKIPVPQGVRTFIPKIKLVQKFSSLQWSWKYHSFTLVGNISLKKEFQDLLLLLFAWFIFLLKIPKPCYEVCKILWKEVVHDEKQKVKRLSDKPQSKLSCIRFKVFFATEIPLLNNNFSGNCKYKSQTFVMILRTHVRCHERESFHLHGVRDFKGQNLLPEKHKPEDFTQYILYMVFPFFKWIASSINLIGWLK